MNNSTTQRAIKDANEAVASVAYKFSEMVAIYPITPSSPMAEWCDQWATEGKKNLWGIVPEVVEMESEAGAAGTVHGALQGGVLTTTFTASQGLLLMIPNLYKIAGELTPFCMHVTARALATHALSIFGDHSDVMATRQTGMALLSSHSVQAAHDMAAIAHAATLQASVPFIHFFDGFRTSHEINTYVPIEEDVLKALVNENALAEFRKRGLNPDAPIVRGTAQNPDVYFQGRERSNLFYQALPKIVDEKMRLFEKLTGRAYHLFDYYGDPKAEYVFVVMGSGSETIRQTVDYLAKQGKKVGVVTVHLYRPFSAEFFLKALPETAKHIIVLDRTKEPGAIAEPLCQDVQATLQEAYNKGQRGHLPNVIGGRYGLGSKEFTPSMVNAVFEAAEKRTLPNSFTVGIDDDLTHLSVPVTQALDLEEKDCFRAIFYGLGSDGTVGANKNTIKIIGNETDRFVQAYFVYDSKKSGAMTVSHLRFGPKPIETPYLIESANFVACHQFQFVDHYDILGHLQEGGIFLLNAPFAKEDVWRKLPQEVQKTILDKHIRFYAIDAYDVARKTGMGGRINTIMQTCFFAISGILPKDEAIACIKNAIKKTYGKKGDAVVQSNCAAVDATLEHLNCIEPGQVCAESHKRVPLNLKGGSEFIQNVTRMLLEQKGDQVPVSALPANGTWPTGTTCFEKRDLAQSIPEWDPSVCIQCNRCSSVCPHAAIRAKHYDSALLAKAPEGFKSVAFRSKDAPNHAFTIQVSPENCTGCGLCSEVCPAKNRQDASKKALSMVHKAEIFETAKRNSEFFDALPWPDTTEVKLDAKNTQFRQPLFEFSGACAGCGETSYIKTLTQLFGDHLIIANATGCSSIYGGNLPTTPYTKNAEGRGPAWANSLFEDNAEFGFGLRLSTDKKTQTARELLRDLQPELKQDYAALLQSIETEKQRIQHRTLVDALKQELSGMSSEKAELLLPLTDFLVEKSVWTIGGDGWAYDIGFGGLDHVLASGRNINVLVLDTEVYSNTGGQQSKSTPIGAVAKFAAAGKERAKKDLGLLAMMYGHVYVAQ
ncbi:MAG: pyruvate:ferredoxin (flavodoxin) oxidoreductase, partial [bacterium]